MGLVWHYDSLYPQSTLQTMEEEAEPEGESLPITPDDADVPSMQTNLSLAAFDFSRPPAALACIQLIIGHRDPSHFVPT